MIRLHDRTRRFWVVLLFLLGGPLLTAMVIFTVWKRSGNAAALEEQRRLMQWIGQGVTVDAACYIRPGETYLLGVALKDTRLSLPIFYCPELYMVAEKRRSGSNVVVDSLLQQRPYLRESTSDFPRDFSSYYRVVIPTLYLRYSAAPSLNRAVSEFMERLSDQSLQVLFFDIQSVVILYSDGDFQEQIDRNRSGLTAKKRQPPRSSDALLPKNKEDRFESPDVSVEAVQLWMKRFNSQSTGISLKDIRGSYAQTPILRQGDISFHFEHIPISQPARISWKSDASVSMGLDHNPEVRLTGSSSFLLDSRKSPFPSTFASIFAPIFYLAGNESWFEGVIIYDNAPNPELSAPLTAPDEESNHPARRRTTSSCWRLEDFHIRRCDFRPIAKRYCDYPVSGTVADLFFEKGVISGDYYYGTGSISLLKGKIEKTLLQSILEQYRLKLEPPGALMNLFTNNEIPFDYLKLGFQSNRSGIIFSSGFSESNRNIIVAYQQDDFRYGLYLNTPKMPEISYPEIFRLLRK